MLNNRIHGATAGGKWTPTYLTWKNMKSRCLNKNNQDYRHYGGRGILLCKRWLKFENFLADMGEKPKGKSIDRKNNNNNYTPENCRWATQKTQMSNTRKNVFISYQGMRLCLSEWARLIGIDVKVLSYRHKQGWSPRDVLMRPSGRWKWDESQYITYNGKTLSVREWTRRTGIKYTTLRHRLKVKWPIQLALTKGARKYRAVV